MLSRRDFLALAAAHAGLAVTGCRRAAATLPRVVVNDVHSRLNPTTVFGPVRPVSRDALGEALARAARQGLPVSLCGSRHAMGGQQFASDSGGTSPLAEAGVNRLSARQHAVW